MKLVMLLCSGLSIAGVVRCATHGEAFEQKLYGRSDGERRHDEYFQRIQGGDTCRLEEEGGGNDYTKISEEYKRNCTCGIVGGLRPFRCTNGFLIMRCIECYDVYLVMTRDGVDKHFTPTRNTIAPFKEKGEDCEVFRQGVTGWARDEETEGYLWDRNGAMYDMWLSRNPIVKRVVLQ